MVDGETYECIKTGWKTKKDVVRECRSGYGRT